MALVSLPLPSHFASIQAPSYTYPSAYSLRFSTYSRLLSTLGLPPLCKDALDAATFVFTIVVSLAIRFTKEEPAKLLLVELGIVPTMPRARKCLNSLGNIFRVDIAIDNNAWSQKVRAREKGLIGRGHTYVGKSLRVHKWRAYIRMLITTLNSQTQFFALIVYYTFLECPCCVCTSTPYCERRAEKGRNLTAALVRWKHCLRSYFWPIPSPRMPPDW